MSNQVPDTRENSAAQAAKAEPTVGALPTPLPNSAAEIREQLKYEIESGILVPGKVLDERTLAARFGVSRTKVRQALHQLAGIGLICIEPYLGARVSTLSISGLRDVLEYCSELEILVVKLAARRISATSQNAIEQSLDLCRAAVDGEGSQYREANKTFHDALGLAACSPYLVKQLNQARGLLLRYAPSSLDTPARIQRSLTEHEAIAKAVLSQNEQAAAEQMAAHLPTGSMGFSEFLARIPTQHFGAAHF